ncbi:histone methyltransferase set1 [Entomophthora muscae]|uniref:Histone methyltransferase set1 n=1 Tax=Entomophthora muscae TaxID=34485 RepID=A0ACC2UNJ0_9FUNG|nr:histone methyltransferase set1 [Entomophthora muscae]
MSVTKQQLKMRFSEFGEVLEVGFPKCPHTYATFGVAYVLYGKGKLRDATSASMAKRAADNRTPIVMDGATLNVRLDERRLYLKEQIEIQKARALKNLSEILTRQPVHPPLTEPVSSFASRPLASSIEANIHSSPRSRADPLHRVATSKESASPRTPVKQPRDYEQAESSRMVKFSKLKHEQDSYESPQKAWQPQEFDHRLSPTKPKALHWPNDPFPFPDFKPPTFEESVPQVDYCVTVESRYLPLLIADEAAMLGHLRQFGAREVFKERRCWVIVFDNKILAGNCLQNPNAMSYQGYTMVGKVQALSEFRKLEESTPSVPAIPSTDLKPRTLPSTGLPSFKRITNRMRSNPQPAPGSPPQLQTSDSRSASPNRNHRAISPSSARRPFEPVIWSPVESESTVEESPPLHSTGSARTQGYYPTAGIKRFRQTFTVGDTGVRRGSQTSKWNPISTVAKNHAAHLKKSGERVILARSNIHDWGLFAREPLKKGDLVIEYVGELIRSELADIREFKCFARGIDSSYLFRIDEEFVIDATDSGNIARFINHSCQPNCKAEIESIGSRAHIFIYASEDIPRFQEVTYDYQFPLEEESTKIKCLCNTPVCRGFLN